MVAFTLGSICTDIHEQFETVAGLNRVYNYDEIPDSIPNMDLPLAMVYPNIISPYSGSSETHTFSFGGDPSNRTSIRDWVYVADVFAKQRAQFAESLAILVPLAQEVIDMFEGQNGHNLLGASGAIKSFQFEGERVVINYSQADYDALRITINVRIF